MASTPKDALTILEVSQVAPISNSPELSLPLTYFDTAWHKFFPAEFLFFYKLADSNPTHFNSVIVPKLKHSLSLTLTHFSALAGRLTWPAHDSIPSILYKPNDSISLTIAVSMNPETFIHLTGNRPYEANESPLYVPELHVTDSEAAVISLQVTLFPNHGLAIGISFHHATLDGKSLALFVKAWAHISKHLHAGTTSEAPPLPPELTPFLDRSGIQDPDGLALELLDFWVKVKCPCPDNPRSLKLLPAFDLDPSLVRANFEVSPEDVSKLRELLLPKLGIDLSTFVLALSHSLTCLVKAMNLGSRHRKIRLVFPVESRSRMEPPIPSTYLGNCVGTCGLFLDREVIEGEEGLVTVAKEASQGIKELGNKSVYEMFKGELVEHEKAREVEAKVIGVSGSPRFELYKTDFGWGRPVKVETTSIDRTGAISMADSKDGSGGVEIGLVLDRYEMEVLERLFVGGLKDL